MTLADITAANALFMNVPAADVKGNQLLLPISIRDPAERLHRLNVALSSRPH